MMQWTPEADKAVRKVPFFVRKRVRARVEQEAREAGRQVVSLADVKATQKRYLNNMASEIKGYQLELCFGPSGCPNRLSPDGETLAENIEALLKQADLVGFLKSKGVTDLKFHHEFRVTLADCPNACSQPQIKDIGIIAALFPAQGESDCTGCNACVEACREDAVTLRTDEPAPVIDTDRCLGCARCIRECPGGALVEGVKGYRVQLGGKLGRHPRLATELPGVYDARAVIDIVADCIMLYKSKCKKGERFAELLQESDLNLMVRKHSEKRIPVST